VPRNVLQQHFQNQTGNRVEVAGKGITPNAQGFEGNRAPSCEGIDYEWRFFTMRCFDQSASAFKIRRLGGIIPIREVGNEHEQSLAQFLIAAGRGAVR
jgi:hypothetical protein